MTETLLALYGCGAVFTLIIGCLAAWDGTYEERKWGARIAIAFLLWPLTVLTFLALGVIYLIDLSLIHI